MFVIDRKYNERLNDVTGDIHEHLPTLREYASKCSSVVEMGVRSIVSTWAFLKGLSESDSTVKNLTSVDIENIDMENVIRCAKDVGIDMKFIRHDSASVDVVTDLLFIDTWHIYGHLKRELDFHHTKVAKYIIMHDTEIDGIHGESIRCNWNIIEQSKKSGYPVDEITKGLRPAIDEFLAAHQEWTLEKEFTNNNGLIILARSLQKPPR